MTPEFPALMALKKFERDAGISRMTSWRYRKNGWLKTITIAGKPYLTRTAFQDFIQRAEAGEFAVVFKK